MHAIRDVIANGAASIYDTGVSPDLDILGKSFWQNDKFVMQMMRYIEFGKLLTYGMTVTEIYLFFTRTFRGLLFMKFSLRDVKRLEETDQLNTLVQLYNIRCDDLRAVFGSQMSIQNLLSFGWNAKTFRSLGIDMHQLCVLRLQKDHIPSFGFTQSEWMNDLRMTKTVIKILRIHASDFRKPGGKLSEAGWDLGQMIRHVNLSVEETIKLQLNGYSSCFMGKNKSGISKQGRMSPEMGNEVGKKETEGKKGKETETKGEKEKETETISCKRRTHYDMKKKKIIHYNSKHSPQQYLRHRGGPYYQRRGR
jgi:hypothetical protein